MLNTLEEKSYELTIIMACKKARKAYIETNIMKPKYNMGVPRTLQEKVIFICNGHSPTEMENSFYPHHFRNYSMPCFTMELIRECS